MREACTPLSLFVRWVGESCFSKTVGVGEKGIEMEKDSDRARVREVKRTRWGSIVADTVQFPCLIYFDWRGSVGIKPPCREILVPRVSTLPLDSYLSFSFHLALWTHRDFSFYYFLFVPPEPLGTRSSFRPLALTSFFFLFALHLSRDFAPASRPLTPGGTALEGTKGIKFLLYL